jgi:hypothetical protein
LYKTKFGKRLDKKDYRLIKDVIDGKISLEEAYKRNPIPEVRFMLQFNGDISAYQENMRIKFGEISNDALCNKGLHSITFPEGTRSERLKEGKTGVAQLALYTGKEAFAVACNGSDRIYPGNSPVPKKGRIVYRFKKVTLEEFKIEEDFILFSRESQEKFKANFEGATRVIMAGINEGLDPKYRNA